MKRAPLCLRAPQNDLDPSQRSKWPGKLLNVHNVHIIAFKGQQEHIYMDWDSIILCWWVKLWFLGIHADLHPEMQLLMEAFPFPTMLSFHLSLFSLHPSIGLGYGGPGVSGWEAGKPPGLVTSPHMTLQVRQISSSTTSTLSHLLYTELWGAKRITECLRHSNQVFFSVSIPFFSLVLCRDPAPSFFWALDQFLIFECCLYPPFGWSWYC